MAKTMTNGQIEHLANRIDGEIEKAVDKFTASLDGVDVSKSEFKQKVALIRSGQAVLKKDSELNTYTDLKDAYTYPTLDKVMAGIKKQAEKNDVSVEKFKKPLMAKRQAIMDNAILGGADEALAALQDFVAQLNK